MIWWIVATVIAFFVKGLCGFANTLVFNTILSFGHNNINISPVELLLGYPSNVILAWKERKLIQWKICLPLASLVLIGNVPGIIFLKNVDTEMVKAIFGIVILVIGMEMMIREIKPKKMKESKILLVIIGILSGILCGLYGIGALLGAYVSRITDSSHAFKANICVVFLIENTFRIILYTTVGIITLESLKQAIVLVIPMLCGLFFGMKSGKILDDKIVKKIVIFMLMVSGVALLIKL